MQVNAMFCDNKLRQAKCGYTSLAKRNYKPHQGSCEHFGLMKRDLYLQALYFMESFGVLSVRFSIAIIDTAEKFQFPVSQLTRSIPTKFT